MSQESAPMHDVVAQGLDEITDKARQKFTNPHDMQSTQTADIDGRRLTINVDNNLDFGPSKCAEVADNPIDELNDHPEFHISGVPIRGADTDLGLRNPKAVIYQNVSEDRGVHSRAEVSTQAGNYTAQQADRGVSGTVVERPGYGTVEIKSPQARELVAKLATKAIKETQDSVQAVKGKEQVQDREWYKQARRSARRIIGKDTPKAA